MVSDFANEMNKKYQKKLGKDVIFPASDDRFRIKRIPTGILGLDILTGGGLPVGRWCEIYGDESLLKTSIAMMAIAEAQRLGFAGMYCNVERNVSEELFQLRGVDTSPEKLTVVQAEIAEDYLDIIKEAMEKEIYKIIVVDSIAALFTKREADSKADTTVGAQGLLTSKMGRVLTASNDNATALVLVNQTREKINTGGYGADTVTRPGGKAPRFYDSMIIRLTRIGTERDHNLLGKGKNKKSRGYRQLKSLEIAVEIEKTKSGGKMGSETVIHYDTENNRIDIGMEILTQGMAHGLVKKRGSLLQIGNQNKYQKQWVDLLNSKPKLARRLSQKILEVIDE